MQVRNKDARKWRHDGGKACLDDDDDSGDDRNIRRKTCRDGEPAVQPKGARVRLGGRHKGRATGRYGGPSGLGSKACALIDIDNQ